MLASWRCQPIKSQLDKCARSKHQFENPFQLRAPDGSTPYHCGDYDQDSDFYLPDFTSTQSSVLVWFHSSDKEKTHGHRGFQFEYTKVRYSLIHVNRDVF